MRHFSEKLHRIRILSAVIGLSLFLSGTDSVLAAGGKAPNPDAEGVVTFTAGAGAVLDPKVTGQLTETILPETGGSDVSGNTSTASQAQEQQESPAVTALPDLTGTLVMADVNEAMNVREEPDASSTKIGVLYKDCGGTVLEQTEGWTKIKSGGLTGWASNDYLLFGEEAKALASEVGVTTATVKTDSLRIRREPSMDSHVLGLVGTGDKLEVIREDDGSGFVMVDFDGADGYVSAEYVDISFRIDNGETLEEIRKREEEERKAKLKAKLTANQGAVKTSDDELRLLAALIQCEAGNQPYEGQLAVGAVVMNRVRSGAYPNSVVGVVYASGQFTPAGTGHVADLYNNGGIKDSCMQAAQAAINGQTTVGGATHFRRAGAHDGIVIGGHVFW